MLYRGFTSDWGVNCEKREYVVLFIYYTVLVWGTFFTEDSSSQNGWKYPLNNTGTQKKEKKKRKSVFCHCKWHARGEKALKAAEVHSKVLCLMAWNRSGLQFPYVCVGNGRASPLICAWVINEVTGSMCFYLSEELQVVVFFLEKYILHIVFSDGLWAQTFSVAVKLLQPHWIFAFFIIPKLKVLHFL